MDDTRNSAAISGLLLGSSKAGVWNRTRDFWRVPRLGATFHFIATRSSSSGPGPPEACLGRCTEHAEADGDLLRTGWCLEFLLRRGAAAVQHLRFAAFWPSVFFGLLGGELESLVRREPNAVSVLGLPDDACGAGFASGVPGMEIV
jgi:hypothetical protein